MLDIQKDEQNRQIKSEVKKENITINPTGTLDIITNNCIPNVQYPTRNWRITGYVFTYLRLNQREI